MKHTQHVIPEQCLNDPCEIPNCPARYIRGHTYAGHDFKPVYQGCGRHRKGGKLAQTLEWLKFGCEGVQIPCK